MPSPRADDSLSQFRNVWRKAHGVGRNEDHAAANEILNDMDQENPVVMFNQGVLHLHGMGRPEDPARAIEYFRKSADKGG